MADEVYQNHPDSVDKLCFVFPSKRSGLFFKRELAKRYQKVLWSPQVITIDTFVSQLSGLELIGPLEQVFQLYRVHREQNIQPQLPFDKFIDQAKVILADFNDIDMALADADDLFDNLLSYIEIGVWNPEDGDTRKLANKYIESYKNLAVYYRAYRKLLLKQDKAYQGLAYRYIHDEIQNKALDISVLNNWDVLYVAGLNALTPAEKQLFNWLRKEKTTKLYFEAEQQMIEDFNQESGLFLREFYANERTNFKWKDDLLTDARKNICTYSVNGNLAMARTAGKLLEDDNLEKDSNTAVVLADENLLLPVLESLPEQVGNVNVTLGYPLGLTAFMSLAEQLFAMQKMARSRGGQREFFYRDLQKVLTNPVLISVLDKKQTFTEILQENTRNNRIWIPQSEIVSAIAKIEGGKFISDAFSDWGTHTRKPVEVLNAIISRYSEMMEEKEQTDDVLVEQLYFFKTALGQLENYLQTFQIPLSLDAMRKIFKHVVAPLEVPFSGEPLAGIQVLGLLETRLLSFKNVIFVSVNEGIIPSKNTRQSMLPLELRAHFKIQTHQHRESIFAYHFYRILSQAENIYLIYDSSTAGVGANEKSRFVRQIEQEWPEKSLDIRFSSKVGVFEQSEINESSVIQKTPEVIANIEKYLTGRGLSPSALNTFLESPTDFYYQSVLGIREADSVDEDMEHSTFGSIVHRCLEDFYKPYEGEIVNWRVLQKKLGTLDTIIHTRFTEKISNYETGKQYLSFYAVSQFVKRFVKLEIEHLKQNTNVVLKNTELELNAELEIDGLNVRFKGEADRIEERNGLVYVIDYKTGKVKDGDLVIVEDEELGEIAPKPKANQLLMYAWLVHKAQKKNKVSAGIYSLRNTNYKLYEAAILRGKEKVSQFETREFEFIENFLRNIVREMLDPGKPLKRANDYKFAVF